jgi:hypothetical protein
MASQRISVAGTVILLALLAMGCSQGTAPPPGAQAGAQTAAEPNPNPAAASPEAPRVPPFYKNATEGQPLPKPVSPARYDGYPVLQKAYSIAAEIPEVLAQQPCYCYCDRSAGHKSLASCWADDHGAT